MNKDTLPIKDRFVIRPLEQATYIESVMKDYLIDTHEAEPEVLALVGHFPQASGAAVLLLRNRERPPFPHIGMAIVLCAIEHWVEENSAWTRRQTPSFERLMKQFIKKEWQETHEVFDLLRNLLIEIRTDVKLFLGNERWIMHFLRTRGLDIFIEKSIDYRIYDWERRHAAGEF
jgi:hypothetical protein